MGPKYGPFFMRNTTIKNPLPFHEVVELAKLLDSSKFTVEIEIVKVWDNFTNRQILRVMTNKDLYIHTSDRSEVTPDLLNLLNQELVKPVVHTEWDARLLRLADSSDLKWSKDPSTKVSAIIARGKYPIATSYNGFPPGIADTPERLNNRELKYKLVQHAEANAIATCAKLGIATEGATMAVTHFPCSTCAGLMISAGIKKVIIKQPTPDFLSRWEDSIILSNEMFAEADVEVVVIDLDDAE